MEPKKHQVWERSESREVAVEVEAYTPCQAAFFAANIKKPCAPTEFVVDCNGEQTIIEVTLHTVYQVKEPKKGEPGAP